MATGAEAVSLLVVARGDVAGESLSQADAGPRRAIATAAASTRGASMPILLPQEQGSVLPAALTPRGG
jgi:hypothetical protein